MATTTRRTSPDSAGAGKWRGGYGALFALRFNEDGSALSVQIGSGAEETAPFGLAGGARLPPRARCGFARKTAKR